MIEVREVHREVTGVPREVHKLNDLFCVMLDDSSKHDTLNLCSLNVGSNVCAESDINPLTSRPGCMPGSTCTIPASNDGKYINVVYIWRKFVSFYGYVHWRMTTEISVMYGSEKVKTTLGPPQGVACFCGFCISSSNVYSHHFTYTITCTRPTWCFTST